MMAGAWANGPALSASPRLTQRLNSRLCTRAPAHPRTRAPAHPRTRAPAHPRTYAPAHLRTSENVFDAELHDAAVLSTRNLTERRRADDAVRLAKARLVPDVETFDAHLDAMVSGEIEALEHGQIRPLEAGAADAVAAGIARTFTGFRERQHSEARRVEVLCRRLWTVIRIARHIGPRRHLANVEHRALRDGERESAL